MEIRKEFQSHDLNDDAIAKTVKVREVLTRALTELEALVPVGREWSIVVTKMQEAGMFAVRGIAVDPTNAK